METVFPHTEQQLCVIHQIRNSTKYVSWKDIKPVMADLKLIYGAPTLEDAEYRLEEFREKWGAKYPQILKSWDTNWTELSTYFKYPQEVRTLIYTLMDHTISVAKTLPPRKSRSQNSCIINGSHRLPNHSHSTVAGGFGVTSKTTRLTPATSLVIRTATVSISACGSRADPAVTKSRVVTARSAMVSS